MINRAQNGSFTLKESEVERAKTIRRRHGYAIEDRPHGFVATKTLSNGFVDYVEYVIE